MSVAAFPSVTLAATYTTPVAIEDTTFTLHNRFRVEGVGYGRVAVPTLAAIENKLTMYIRIDGVSFFF